VDNKPENTDGQSVVALDDASMESWQAYNAMFESKQRHYEFLELLENKKKKFNLSPTDADKQKLAEYLEQHDAQVKRFITLSQQLKASKPESHELFIKFIAQLGDGEPNKKVKH